MHELRQTKQTRLLLGDFIVEVVVGRNTVKRTMADDNQYYKETEGHG